MKSVVPIFVCLVLAMAVRVCIATEGAAEKAGGGATEPGQTFETFVPKRIEPMPKEFVDVGVDERMGAKLPLELTVVDDSGKTIALRDLFTRGKPVILQLGYFGCPKLCGQVSEATLDSITELDLLMGRDFEMIYLSFDPKERSTLAREKKLFYVQRYVDGKSLTAQQSVQAANGWHFLTTDQVTATAITRAVGFKYKWVESAQQYSHAAVLIMITPDGTVSRYLYGAAFPSKTLRLSLVDASSGKVGSIMDQLILFCFHFDPNTGTYTVQAMRLMKFGGFLTVMCLGAMTGLMVLRGRQMRGVNSGRKRRGLSAVLAAGSSTVAVADGSGTTER